jgi:hypothetical protein
MDQDQSNRIHEKLSAALLTSSFTQLELLKLWLFKIPSVAAETGSTIKNRQERETEN